MPSMVPWYSHLISIGWAKFPGNVRPGSVFAARRGPRSWQAEEAARHGGTAWGLMTWWVGWGIEEMDGWFFWAQLLEIRVISVENVERNGFWTFIFRVFKPTRMRRYHWFHWQMMVDWCRTWLAQTLCGWLSIAQMMGRRWGFSKTNTGYWVQLWN